MRIGANFSGGGAVTLDVPVALSASGAVATYKSVLESFVSRIVNDNSGTAHKSIRSIYYYVPRSAVAPNMAPGALNRVIVTFTYNAEVFTNVFILPASVTMTQIESTLHSAYNKWLSPASGNALEDVLINITPIRAV